MANTKKRHNTAKLLVKHAIKLANEKSLQGVSIRELTACCDLTPPAFYRHFASLDALALELLDELSSCLTELLESMWATPPLSFRQMIDQFFKFVLAHQDLFLFFRRERTITFTHEINRELQKFNRQLTIKLQQNTRLQKNAALLSDIILTILFGRGLDILDISNSIQQQHLINLVQQQIALILRSNNS